MSRIIEILATQPREDIEDFLSFLSPADQAAARAQIEAARS